MSDTTFMLPRPIVKLVEARNELQAIYSDYDLEFTLDGNLVGDIGEAIAATLFSIDLSKSNSAGIDGHSLDGRSVQIKATGKYRGPAFRNTEQRADHLIFMSLNFENQTGEVIYNGPEEFVLQEFPQEWRGQKSISMTKIISKNSKVHQSDLLRRVSR